MGLLAGPTFYSLTFMLGQSVKASHLHYVDSGRRETGSSLGRVGTVSTINHGDNVNITRQETRCSCNLRSRLNAFKALLVMLLRVQYLGGFPF